MQQNWSAIKNCGCVKEERFKTASRNVVENPKLLSEDSVEQNVCRRSELAERLVGKVLPSLQKLKYLKKNLTDGLILKHITNLSVALQDGCDLAAKKLDVVTRSHCVYFADT